MKNSVDLPVNVLLTSAGRRVSLLKAFQAAAAPTGGCVLAADCDPLAPALQLADRAVVVPRLDAGNYLDTLLDAVRTSRVGLLVPTIDTELALMAEASEAFAREGCRVVTSLPSFVERTADKWQTHEMFSKAGIPGPASWLPGDTAPPHVGDHWVVKPRRGSASQHVFIVDAQLAHHAAKLVPLPLIQELLVGDEVTLDVLYDDEGTLIHYVPRHRIKTVGGESVVGRTIDDVPFAGELQRVLRALGTLGARLMVTVQMFVSDRGPVFTEVNPRFGGGFPLGYAAGALYPEWMVAWAAGRSFALTIGTYRRNLVMARYYSEAFIPA